MREIETRIEASVGDKKYLTNGSTLEVIDSDELELSNYASNTSQHEATHTAATSPENIELVSIIPGPGYLGITKLKKFDSVAAAAPHAFGMDGTDWDTYLVEANGGSITGNSAAARSRLKNEDEYIDVLSRRLEKVKSMNGNEVKKVRDYVTKGHSIELKITKADGEQIVINEKIKGEIVIVDFTEPDFEKAA